MKTKKVIIYICVIIFVSSFFVLRTSYFQGHDLDFHLSRIISIKDCIEMKKICYVAPKYLRGYGYGTPLFYPELFLILPAIWLHFGLRLSISYRIFIFLINALSILSMYFCSKKIVKNNEKSLFSSFLYAFASYRVIDLTTRGALGEALSFIFFPLIILGIYEIVYGDYKKNYKYLIIGMSGVMLSHILSSVIIFVYLFIFCIINIKKLLSNKQRITYLILSALITLLLTSYFTLPLLEQLFSASYRVSLPTFVLSQRAMPIYHIFLESSFAQIIDGSRWIWSPGTVGTMLIIILALYIISIISKDKYSSFMNQNMIISIVCILLTTKLFPWKILDNILHIIQFPWRLNIIPAIILPLFGSYIIDNYKENKKMFIILIIIVGIFSIQSITVFKNTTFVNKDIYDDYEIMFGEYLPLSFDNQNFIDRKDIVSNNQNLEYTYEKKDNVLTIDFKNNAMDTNLELPFIYYKGYSAYIDNNILKTYESDNGLVGIIIDNKYKEGRIKILYKGTLIQKVTLYISIISLIGYLLLNIKKIKIKQ